jgi:hypothetical protein
MEKRDLVDKVEIYEVKHFDIYAKNKADARQALQSILQSQDKIHSLVSVGRGYEATVHVFCARDYPIGSGKVGERSY